MRRRSAEQYRERAEQLKSAATNVSTKGVRRTLLAIAQIYENVAAARDDEVEGSSEVPEGSFGPEILSLWR